MTGVQTCALPIFSRQTGMITFPQIVIEGQSIGGFDELLAADRAGRLGELVEA